MEVIYAPFMDDIFFSIYFINPYTKYYLPAKYPTNGGQCPGMILNDCRFDIAFYQLQVSSTYFSSGNLLGILGEGDPVYSHRLDGFTNRLAMQYYFAQIIQILLIQSC